MIILFKTGMGFESLLCNANNYFKTCGKFSGRLLHTLVNTLKGLCRNWSISASISFEKLNLITAQIYCLLCHSLFFLDWALSFMCYPQTFHINVFVLCCLPQPYDEKVTTSFYKLGPWHLTVCLPSTNKEKNREHCSKT